MAGKYRITERHVNKNLYIQDFWQLTGLLEEKYGRPKEYGSSPNQLVEKA